MKLFVLFFKDENVEKDLEECEIILMKKYKLLSSL